MILFGQSEGLWEALTKDDPTVGEAVSHSAGIRGQMLDYQAAALFTLAKKYNFGAANILEIGTLVGYSTSLLAQAAPLAKITTLNPAPHEVRDAAFNLKFYRNVTIQTEKSWDYLARYNGPNLDFIFVDGDHNRISRDIPWYNKLKTGGMILFHDYHPTKSRIVHQKLQAMRTFLGRDFDVSLVDADLNGMVGIIKQDGEEWPMQMQRS